MILGKNISVSKWLALVLLVLGTILSQSNFHSSRADIDFRGLVAAICAVCTSGLAGVLCERLLKGGSRDVTMSTRNIQLGVPSCMLGIATLYIQDKEKVMSAGLFQGFTKWTWVVVVLHSIGGLLVTAVMKFADNLLKGLAMAASLILSCFLSMYYFEFILTSNFLAGSLLVLLGTFIYLLEDEFCGATWKWL
jgi:UDP-sugar transporter A1/2/3